MNRNESVLHLKRPKLLTDIITDSNNLNKQLDFNVSDTNHFEYQGAKPIMISKVDNPSLDFVDHQKTKIKHKKKIKNKTYISNVNTGTDGKLKMDDLDSEVFLKTSKNLKNKRNPKNKALSEGKLSVEFTNSSNSIYLSNDLLTLQELALKLNVPSTDIIKWLFLQGISVTINQLLDISIATLVANHYSFSVSIEKANFNISNPKTDNQLGRLRSPVITVLGHVDHGKTSLLKAIRQDNILIEEAGDITQAIGFYEVTIETPEEPKKLIFLDTPGHEAFVSMRKRGAEITDLFLLVVAADDGLKPQTIEAISYIQSRNLPFIVAINKIDKPEADVKEVIRQLSAFNISESSHAFSDILGVSALTGQNIDMLLSSLIHLSKNQNLRSDPSLSAQGAILEAHLDKQRGPVAQLLIQNGTLYKGDIVVAGQFYGKVKAIYNSNNKKIESVESTALVYVLCFSEVPDLGLFFEVVPNEKRARILSSEYVPLNTSFGLLNNRISLDNVNQKGLNAKRIVKCVNLIIKTDAQGSIDPIVYALSDIPQEKVQINLLLVAPGEISFKDIQLAFTSQSNVIGFNLNVSSNVLDYAGKSNVVLKEFNVIYDLIDYVKEYMLQFVDLDYEKKILGYAEVKNLFFVNKRVVAGCFVHRGQLKKEAHFYLKRKDENVYTGLIDSLKRLKEDVNFVNAENECGVMCKDYDSWHIGDFLECYDLQPLEKQL